MKPSLLMRLAVLNYRDDSIEDYSFGEFEGGTDKGYGAEAFRRGCWTDNCRAEITREKRRNVLINVILRGAKEIVRFQHSSQSR